MARYPRGAPQIQRQRHRPPAVVEVGENLRHLTTKLRVAPEHIGQPRAVRAVAGACAANSLAVIVPCHRVVREACSWNAVPRRSSGSDTGRRLSSRWAKISAI
jgi:O-6-methylguanine DNA methyltransferase